MAQSVLQPAASAASARGLYGWFIAGAAAWFMAWGMQNVLFSWLVVGELHADAHWVGTTQTCMMLPGLVLLLFGGATADRHDRRRLLLRVHVLAAVLALALASIVGAGGLSFSVLIVYALCVGSLPAFALPARDSLLSEVAGNNLMRAVTGMTMIQFAAQALGALAGGTARWYGSAPALVVQAVIVLIGLLPLLQLPAARAAAAVRPPVATLREIREGLREVWHSERLRPPVLLVVWNGLLFIGPFFVVFPLLVRDFYHGDIGQLGLVNMTFPLGTIVGSLTLLLRGGVRHKGRALLRALFGGGLCLTVTAIGLPFWGFLVAIFAWGLCGAVAFNTSRTLVQEAAPASHRARVLSVYQLGFMGTAPLGALESGFAADLFGPLVACALSGVAMLVVVLLARSFSRIPNME